MLYLRQSYANRSKNKKKYRDNVESRSNTSKEATNTLFTYKSVLKIRNEYTKETYEMDAPPNDFWKKKFE